MERLGEGRSSEGSCWLASAFFFFAKVGAASFGFAKGRE
jgi:hypothetical protein